MSENAAFELLSNIEQQAKQLEAQGLSYVSQSAGVKNIAFMVNGINFYCDSREIKEVSTCEGLMAVPQTKQWMRGLVNSKGVLYSVSDLSLLAGFGRAIQASRGHLLLLNDDNSQSALLINRVIGFRYFDDSTAIKDIEAKKDQLEGLAAYVEDGFTADGEDWFRLNVSTLISSEQFREVQ